MGNSFEYDPELTVIFTDGAQEMLDQLENVIIQLEKGAIETDEMDEALRQLHTIKGNSSMMGYLMIRDLTHGMESVFQGIKRNEILIDQDVVNQIIAGVDCMRKMVANVKEGKEECAGNVTYESCLAEVRRGR